MGATVFKTRMLDIYYIVNMTAAQYQVEFTSILESMGYKCYLDKLLGIMYLQA